MLITRWTLVGCLAAAVPVFAAEPAGKPGSLERTQAMVDAFRAHFGTIGPALADGLDQLYSEDIWRSSLQIRKKPHFRLLVKLI
jgi:hypothetical protein